AADRGRRMRRPYEGSFFLCRGEACLALSPHARLLIEGDACVAPTKVPSSCVGARHASPYEGMDRYSAACMVPCAGGAATLPWEASFSSQRLWCSLAQFTSTV